MVSALSLAFGAALFTVIGFRELFQPTFNITYMAATIELCKIIAVSALYQFRHILGLISKAFLYILILGAMAVTSMGVYGYLSSSFERDSLSLTKNESRLELLEQRKSSLEARLADMDSQIAAVPETYVTKRMELIETFGPERRAVITEIEELDDRRLDLTLEQVEKQTEFGAILLLARSVEWLDEDQAMLYFIFLIIFIFDPLAITLTHAANVGFANVANTRDEAKKQQFNEAVSGDPDRDVMGELGDIVGDAIAPVAESVSKVSSEVENLKNQKPTNPRSSVIDSMRKDS